MGSFLKGAKLNEIAIKLTFQNRALQVVTFKYQILTYIQDLIVSDFECM